MVGWPEAIVTVALAIVVVAVVVLVRGPELVSAWARNAYEEDDGGGGKRATRQQAVR